MPLRTTPTALDRFKEALDRAEANLARITAKQDETYESAVAAADHALLAATVKHDEAVRAAADKRAADRAAEQGRHDALVKRATEEFDRAAPQEVGALAGTRVTGTAGSTWWLHDPRSRQPVAHVSPSHGGMWRCHAPDGSVLFLPTEVAARSWLWQQAALEAVA
jgi:hypothetical protein